MLYQSLHTFCYLLEPKEERQISAGDKILIPEDDSKIFLHILGDDDKVKATHTLNGATRISNKSRLINGSDRVVEVKILEIS